MPCCLRAHDAIASGSNSTDREILPELVQPSHYVVNITPDFDTFKFSGTVHVLLKVIEDCQDIVCNANELTISSAHVIKTVDGSEERFDAKEITLDAAKELVKFSFESSFTAGSEITLVASFTGLHNDKMAGFYRSGYTDKDGLKKWMVVTQFEATDCRRAFPCWDEPALKATFDVTLNVNPAFTALSNMNLIKQETIHSENGVELNACTFATTPIMSTYLVAFAVGDFEYIETMSHPKKPVEAAPITVRVYTLKGDSAQGKFALDVGARTLEFFSEYFDIPYPLPKMDMIAVPDFGAGAMENWGLVTYRNIYLLFDEKTSSAKSKQQVAYVVGHELAHQWFGNLVTMDWWSDLWLNEGFATFVGWMAVDQLFPEWDIWTQFVIGDFASGLSLDALRSSHPIEVDVKSPTEIFDAISYSKGASVIRMLNSFLGQDTFMNGVRDYLKKFKYSNAKTNDLWAHLSTASGKNVETLMYNWTRHMGYPMVTVESESVDASKNEITLLLKQTRFLSSGDLTAEEDSQCPVWWIPLGVCTNDKAKTFDLILKDKESAITFPYDSTNADAYYKLNLHSTGFFRVNLPVERLSKLSLNISKDPTTVTTRDRVGLVADSFALAAAGYGSTVAALQVLKNFSQEQEYVVLNEMASQLNSISSIWYQEPVQVKDRLNQLKRDIFSPQVSALGYEYSANENQLTAFKRTLAISCAAKAGDKQVIDELMSRFNKFINGDTILLHPNLKSVAYSVVLRNSTTPKETFEQILSIYQTAETTDQKLAALASLGATSDKSLVERLLNEIALDSSLVRPQDIIYPLVALTSDSPIPTIVRPMLWDWLVKNWALFVERYKPSLALLGRVLSSCTEKSIGLDFVKTVEKWSLGDGLEAEEKTKRVEELALVKNKLDQALENIKIHTAWYERVHVDVAQWLESEYVQAVAVAPVVTAVSAVKPHDDSNAVLEETADNASVIAQQVVNDAVQVAVETAVMESSAVKPASEAPVAEAKHDEINAKTSAFASQSANVEAANPVTLKSQPEQGDQSDKAKPLGETAGKNQKKSCVVM